MLTILQILYAFGSTFIACDLSQRIERAFEECNDVINQFKWYWFPIEIQRLLPLIMIAAQQPIEIKTFGSVACDRDTFKRVSTGILIEC